MTEVLKTDNFSKGVNRYIEHLELIINEQKKAIESMSKKKEQSLIRPMKP